MANTIWHECEDEACAIVGRMRLEGYPEAAIPNLRSLTSKLFAARMGRGERMAVRQLDYGRPGRRYGPDGRHLRHRRS